MNTEMIYCPSCNHKLRVPSDLMGQRVECPKCNSEFDAPPPRMSGDSRDRFSDPPVHRPRDDDFPRSRQIGDRDEPYERPARRSALGVLMAPAIAVIALGVLSLLVGAIKLVMIVTNPAQIRQQAQQFQQMMMPGGGAPAPFDPMIGALVFLIILMSMSVLQIVGGACMVRRRFYPLAMIGAVLAIINCSDLLTCIPSFAIGIWAFVVLLMPGVRAHFHRAS